MRTGFRFDAETVGFHESYATNTYEFLIRNSRNFLVLNDFLDSPERRS